MNDKFVVACVQNNASNRIEDNIEQTTAMARAAHRDGARFICLAEHFSCIERDDLAQLRASLPQEQHPALAHFRALARTLSSWMLLGSLAIRVSADKLLNRSYLLDDAGEVVAHYDKIHLFDVTLRNGEAYRESSTVQAGSAAELAATPWGLLGMSVCYDVRFAYLYRAYAQAGARFLTAPAAFTRTTGEAHWHVLQRARAIETGSYVFAPCQCGVHAGGRRTYGHSLIVDPWGRVLADGGEEPGYIVAEVDPGKVEEARGMIPALQHDRSFTPPRPAVYRRALGSD